MVSESVAHRRCPQIRLFGVKLLNRCSTRRQVFFPWNSSRNRLRHNVGELCDAIAAIPEALDKQGIGKRASFETHGFAATAIKLFQPVKFAFCRRAVETHAHSLCQRQIRSGVNRIASRNSFRGSLVARYQPFKCLDASDSRLRFCHLNATSESQIEQQLSHSQRSVHATSFAAPETK